jgi:c-di-GMP-binding flagellar brake protein YcgR
MGIEQRRFDRVTASFEVECRRAGALSETWRRVVVIDFSAGGLRFHSEELFEPGEPLELQIRLPSIRMPLLLRAQVVRSESLVPGMCRCAVEFTEVTPDQQAEIDGLVQFLRTPPASS